MIDVLQATALLRAHVARRPEHVTRASLHADRYVTAHGLGDPEIDDLRHHPLAFAAEENVLRLQIAVNQPLLVDQRHRRTHVTQDASRLSQREATLLIQPPPQRLPMQELHHQVGTVGIGAEVEHLNHVRASEPRQRLRLAQEAREVEL